MRKEIINSTLRNVAFFLQIKWGQSLAIKRKRLGPQRLHQQEPEVVLRPWWINETSFSKSWMIWNSIFFRTWSNFVLVHKHSFIMFFQRNKIFPSFYVNQIAFLLLLCIIIFFRTSALFLMCQSPFHFSFVKNKNYFFLFCVLLLKEWCFHFISQLVLYFSLFFYHLL